MDNDSLNGRMADKALRKLVMLSYILPQKSRKENESQVAVERFRPRETKNNTMHLLSSIHTFHK